MNDLRRIDLNLLVILDALFTERHVTRAAQRVHLSQPAVSHALARLRELFGDPLLVRGGAGLVMTARALELRGPLAQALLQVQDLLSPPVFDPGVAKRRLRLAMSDFGAMLLLPGLVQTLRREAPGIDLIISQASRDMMLEQLSNGDIDLAAGVFPVVPDELRNAPLFEESFACLLDRDTLPAGSTLDLTTYLGRPHVSLEIRGTSATEITQALTAIGVTRHVAVSLPHWSVAPQLIKGTDLILTVASRGLNGINDPQLVICKPPFQVPTFLFQMVWHERREADPGLSWLRGRVIEACSDQARSPEWTSQLPTTPRRPRRNFGLLTRSL